MLLKPIDKDGNPKELPENARFKLIFLVSMIVIGGLVFFQASRMQTTISKNQLQKEMSPEPTIYASINNLQDQGNDLISESTKKSQEVLGEATRIATKPAEMARDYVYEITIEETIKKLFMMLPERRKEVLKDELFK